MLRIATSEGGRPEGYRPTLDQLTPKLTSNDRYILRRSIGLLFLCRFGNTGPSAADEGYPQPAVRVRGLQEPLIPDRR